MKCLINTWYVLGRGAGTHKAKSRFYGAYQLGGRDVI